MQNCNYPDAVDLTMTLSLMLPELNILVAKVLTIVQ